jgi:predicted Rdx family selenoprotein
LIRGKGGVFDVTLDGEVLFSKHDTGRFPAPGEVEDLLAPRLAGG